MENKKQPIGFDLVDYTPDYTKSLEENKEIIRQREAEVYGNSLEKPQGKNAE